MIARYLSLALVAGLSSLAHADVLIDTGTVNDLPFQICASDASIRGYAVYVAATQSTTIGRLHARVHAMDINLDSQADPTWDANADGTLSADEPAAGEFIVLDLGATPADLTTLDGQNIRGATQTILYVSPAPISLALPAANGTGAGPVDSGAISVPVVAGHLYAIGFAYSQGGCAAWTVTTPSAASPPPPSVLPTAGAGVSFVTIGRLGILAILNGTSQSSFQLITSSQTDPGSVSFIIDDTNPVLTAADAGPSVPDAAPPAPDAGTCHSSSGCQVGDHGSAGLTIPAMLLVLVLVRRRQSVK